MAIADKIGYEKLQYDINRKIEKISILTSDETDKCKYLTGEEISSSNQSRMMEHASYSPL